MPSKAASTKLASYAATPPKISDSSFDPWLLAIVGCAVAWGMNFPVQSLAFSKVGHLHQLDLGVAVIESRTLTRPCERLTRQVSDTLTPPPGTFAFLRFSLSAVSLLPFCLPTILNVKDASKDLFPVVKDGLVVGLCLAAGYIGQIVGLGAGEPGSEVRASDELEERSSAS